jgi:magnesium chelatase accessory protein
MIVGHSESVPIAPEMVLYGMRPRRGVIGINGALATFDGMAGWLFPATAKLLALTPFGAQFVASTAIAAHVRKLLADTGSQIDAKGHRLYLRLASDPGQIHGVLSMMAQWSIEKLAGKLCDIDVPVLLLTGEKDTAVVPNISTLAAPKMPNAQTLSLGAFGHLVHEEAPEVVHQAIMAHLQT